MTGCENKDNQIGTSNGQNKALESTTKTQEQHDLVIDKIENEEKQPNKCKEGDTKPQNYAKCEKEHENKNVNDGTPKEMEAPLKPHRLNDGISKEKTEDEKKQPTEGNERVTKPQNEAKCEKEHKSEKVNDGALKEMEAPLNKPHIVNDGTSKEPDAPLNKPRKVSDAHAIMGKLDVLLKKHDNELVKKDFSEQEESSNSDVNEMSEEDKNDKSNQEESKSVDQSTKKIKKDKEVTNNSKGEGKNMPSVAETYTGILQKKKSSPFWSWKRYFFALEGKLLMYYDSQQDYVDEQKTPKGTIDLNNIVDVKNKKSGVLKSNYPFILARKSQGPIELATDNSEDREIWLMRIQAELQRADHGSADPEENKLGATEERKSVTIPPEQGSSGSLSTINIQDEISKKEEDIDRKPDVEEEKPVLIEPKKVRGIGVMAFAPIGVVKLKHISKSKMEEKEDKGKNSNVSQEQNTLEKDNITIINKSEEKPEQKRISNNSISKEKVEKGRKSIHMDENINPEYVDNLQTDVENKVSVSPKIIQKSEEDVSDFDTKTTEESELTFPKNVRGDGVINFTPQIVGSQLKKVSTSAEPREDIDNGIDHNVVEHKGINIKDDSENNTEEFEVIKLAPQGCGIQLKILSSSESQEKQETNNCLVDSEQKDSDEKSDILQVKTEKNLVVLKTSTKRKSNTSPTIPLSKNVQSVVNKNKDDKERENNNEKEINSTNDTNQDDESKKKTINKDNESKDKYTEKVKDFIKTDEITNKINIDSENDEPSSKDFNSDETKLPESSEKSNQNKIIEFSDPDLRAPSLRPNRPSSIITTDRKSLAQPEFTVMEEGPLTPRGTHEIERMNFELPSKDTEECISVDEQGDYCPVVSECAIQLRNPPAGADKLLSVIRTSGITGLKAFLDELEEEPNVPDSNIEINNIGQMTEVEKPKSEIR